jgi:hypothetical protein
MNLITTNAVAFIDGINHFPSQNEMKRNEPLKRGEEGTII